MAETIQRAFVTGATGLLGNNLVRRLLAENIPIRALVRSPEKARSQFDDLPREQAAKIEWITGNINDVQSYRSELRGVEAIFHTAAYFREGFGGPRHAEHLHETNVVGTRNLLAAAHEAGVVRVVHTSSIATLKGEPGAMANVTMLRPRNDGNDYYRSKVEADREIEQFLQSHSDAWACMVLPGFMVGPGDAGPTPSGRMIIDFVKKKLPGIPNAAFSVVDARDAAEVMLRAAKNGKRGARYLAGGRKMTMGDICGVLEKVTGGPAPTRHVPDWMLFAVAVVQETGSRFTGRPALLNRETVRLLKEQRERALYDSSITERELGVIFRPVEESWKAAHLWLQAKGFC